MPPIYFLVMLLFINVVSLLTRFTQKERLLFGINFFGFLIFLGLTVLDLLQGRPWASLLFDDGGLSKYFQFLLAVYFVTTLPVVVADQGKLPARYYVGMVGQALMACALIAAESLYLLWLFIPLWFAQSYWFYGLGQIQTRVRPPSRHFLLVLIVAMATSLAVIALSTIFPNTPISHFARVATQEIGQIPAWTSLWGLIFVLLAQQNFVSLFSSQRLMASGALWTTLLHSYYLAIFVNTLFLYRWVFTVGIFWDKGAQSWKVTIENLPSGLLVYVMVVGALTLWQALREDQLLFRIGAWLQLGLLWPFMTLASLDHGALLAGLAVPTLLALGISLVVFLLRNLGLTAAENFSRLTWPSGSGARERVLLAFISLAVMGPGCSFLHSDLLNRLFNSARQSSLSVSWGQYSLTLDQLLVFVLFLLAGVIFWAEVGYLMRRTSLAKNSVVLEERVPAWVYMWGLILIFVGIYPHPLYKYLDHLLKTIMV